MTQTKLNKGSPSLAPHGDILKVPGDGNAEGGRLPGEPSTDVPANPGEPAPYPENPDLPGGPAEPIDPDQAEPIPPDRDTTKPRL